MKEKQLDSKWLDEVRSEMQNFEAPIPADGWERVSSSLPQPRKPMIGKRWMGVAASLAVCAFLGGGYYLIGDEQVAGDGKQVVTENTIEDLRKETAGGKPVQKTAGEMLMHKTANVAPALWQGEFAVSEPMTEDGIADEESVGNELADVTEPSQECQASPSRKDTLIRFADREEKYVLFANRNVGIKARKRAGWSFGINFGANGALKGEGESEVVVNAFNPGKWETPQPDNPDNGGNRPPVDGDQYPGHDGGYGYDPDRVFGFVSDEVYAYAPGHSSGNHTSGITPPVLTDDVIDSKNHALWSFGLSVDRQVWRKTTIETGIVYTLLTSDVEMRCSGIKRQKIHYLGIPLRLNYHVVGNQQCQLYAGGGVMLERALSARRGGDRIDVKPWQWSSNFSIGGLLRVSERLSLYLEPGVSWYFNSDPSAPSLRSESPVYFNLRGGIRFHR